MNLDRFCLAFPAIAFHVRLHFVLFRTFLIDHAIRLFVSSLSFILGRWALALRSLRVRALDGLYQLFFGACLDDPYELALGIVSRLRQLLLRADTVSLAATPLLLRLLVVLLALFILVWCGITAAPFSRMGGLLVLRVGVGRTVVRVLLLLAWGLEVQA